MKYESHGRTIKRVRVRFNNRPECLAEFATVIAHHGALLGHITTRHIGRKALIRDVDIHASNDDVFDQTADAIRSLPCVDLLDIIDVVEDMHIGGKISIRGRKPLQNLDDLSLVYTPGVASICSKIQQNKSLADEFTTIPNNVAIVTNGTAILGLGNIGPVAGMPVMEGKSLLFQELAGINGFPILIDSEDPDVIVRAVTAIAPTFGAIKLEDIRAPECFDIEARLDAALDIPVVHDDQHGTAVVVLAALMNIAKYTHINLKRSTVGIIGLGAAGNGIFRLLQSYGVETIYGADINEAMSSRFEQQGGVATDLDGVMRNARIVISTTGVPGLILPEMVRPKQVILALSNPNPEIDPDVAIEAGAAYAMDGKSVNNAMAFPGLFRGALDARATRVTPAMKIAAAKTIAQFAQEGDLVPNILDRSVHQAVAAAVERVALKTGVVRFASPENVWNK